MAMESRSRQTSSPDVCEQSASSLESLVYWQAWDIYVYLYRIINLPLVGLSRRRYTLGFQINCTFTWAYIYQGAFRIALHFVSFRFWYIPFEAHHTLFEHLWVAKVYRERWGKFTRTQDRLLAEFELESAKLSRLMSLLFS